jgi:hypothetical protein
MCNTVRVRTDTKNYWTNFIANLEVKWGVNEKILLITGITSFTQRFDFKQISMRLNDLMCGFPHFL